MILLEDVLLLHDFSIKDFGGSSSIRDIGFLASAIGRPFKLFERKICIPVLLRKQPLLGEVY